MPERNEHIGANAFTKLMADAFFDNDIAKPGQLYKAFVMKPDKKFVENLDRKRWQFWKPKIVKNKYYDPDYKPIDKIDIVRGGKPGFAGLKNKDMYLNVL